MNTPASQIDCSSLGPLTVRELEVLRLICAGHRTKEIAAILNICFKTAACHRSRVIQKAGVHNSVELLRWALATGHITL